MFIFTTGRTYGQKHIGNYVLLPEGRRRPGRGWGAYAVDVPQGMDAFLCSSDFTEFV